MAVGGVWLTQREPPEQLQLDAGLAAGTALRVSGQWRFRGEVSPAWSFNGLRVGVGAYQP